MKKSEMINLWLAYGYTQEEAEDIVNWHIAEVNMVIAPLRDVLDELENI